MIGSSGKYSPGLTALLLLPLLLLLVFSFLYPVGKMLAGSLFDPDFTFTHYARLFAEPIYAKILLRTFWVAFIATVVGFLLGYPVAYAMAYTRGRYTLWIAACVLIPLWTSVLVRSYAWILLLQRQGVVNQLLLKTGILEQPLRLIYTEGAVIVAMSHVLLPFMILPIFSTLRTIPKELGQAAANLGAGRATTLFKITLPLSLPGVFAGSLMTFILALGFYVTPALVGGPQTMMMATLIAQQTTVVLDWPFAGALATVLLAATLLLTFTFRKVLARTGGLGNV
ncbi:MAG: ABC transporter permease [Mesorhizobium sp.]|uniref:ABC transporter permease n=1 Tax=Mesorhizobium sp. TaxID=1871066 RepID=UPI000FEA588E|nr:ABC transporter permease [Mesorhizobium sp.]RWI32350.1 MAG: ABC transporter permease [Mesorhizobium sp.]RWI62823.1 MAG: ABC transporter permease [Mesorhizobium sp.]RWI80363.1 MAG: ABC transporter permease [Mesorhizobium sp.]RWJ46761.1 MAG: ABC transporter permease [Mesorhizobium sp.]RWJ56674.1 MAG: ABC transporter permease [Mesorhizobium sp.]